MKVKQRVWPSWSRSGCSIHLQSYTVFALQEVSYQNNGSSCKGIVLYASSGIRRWIIYISNTQISIRFLFDVKELKCRKFVSSTFITLVSSSFVQLRLHVQEYNKNEHITRITNLHCRWKILLQVVKEIIGSLKLRCHKLNLSRWSET